MRNEKPQPRQSVFFVHQNGIPTPDKRGRSSRPPSFAGRESPVHLRSRSSTSDSLRSGSSPNSGGNGPRTVFFNPPSSNSLNLPPSTTVTTAASALASAGSGSVNNFLSLTSHKKPAAASSAAASQSSLKKRAAPLPPGGRSASKSGQNHNRNASDYGVSLPAQRMNASAGQNAADFQSRKSFAGDFAVESARTTRPAFQSAAQLRKNVTMFVCAGAR